RPAALIQNADRPEPGLRGHPVLQRSPAGPGKSGLPKPDPGPSCKQLFAIRRSGGEYVYRILRAEQESSGVSEKQRLPGNPPLYRIGVCAARHYGERQHFLPAVQRITGSPSSLGAILLEPG